MKIRRIASVFLMFLLMAAVGFTVSASPKDHIITESNPGNPNGSYTHIEYGETVTGTLSSGETDTVVYDLTAGNKYYISCISDQPLTVKQNWPQHNLSESVIGDGIYGYMHWYGIYGATYDTSRITLSYSGDATANYAVIVVQVTTGHNHTYRYVNAEASCISRGYTACICDCGYYYLSDVQAANVHIYTDFNDMICNVCEHFRGTDGWVQDDGGVMLYFKDGQKMTNRWMQDDNGWRYLNNNGHMVTSNWVSSGGKWYYMNNSGYMVTNRWVNAGGWYYLDANGHMKSNCWMKDAKGYMYLGSSGKMVTNGWVSDGGKWYYMDGNGYMVANRWVNAGGWYYLDGNGHMKSNCWMKDANGYMYLGSSGKMITNGWVSSGGKWYYMNGSGYMVVSNWVDNGNYYVDGNGYMVSNRWMKLSGGYVYLSAGGKKVQNGWVSSGGKWYFMDAQGYMTTNSWVETGGESYYFNKDGHMSINSWITRDGKWHYVDGSGCMLKNKWLNSGGTTYYFNSDGVMLAGQYMYTYSDKLYYFMDDGSLKKNVAFGSGYIGSNGVITDDCWAYLAAMDYRSEARAYPAAVARMGYVHAEVYKGELWVVTYNFYRIGALEYSIDVLYNVTTGERIVDPDQHFEKEYQRLLDRGHYSANDLIEISGKKIQVLRMESYALEKGAYCTGEFLME